MSDAKDVTDDPNIRLKAINFPDAAPRGAVVDFCRRYGVSRSWFYKVRRTASEQGVSLAMTPGPRAPQRRPGKTEPAMIDLLVSKRDQLKAHGWDYGPLSVLARLKREGVHGLPSRATVARIFQAEGRVPPEPKKRPRSSYRRFSWPRANDMWQIDGVEYQLSDGAKLVIIVVLDDCTRLALASLVAHAETSEAAISVVQTAISRHGIPQRFLSDNGTAFNVSRRNRVGQLTVFLESLGVNCVTGKPHKPTTQGKNERSHRTLLQYLDAQHRPTTTATLQALVDEFDHAYNTYRPHQSIDMLTPGEKWQSADKAEPPERPTPTSTYTDWTTRHRVLNADGALRIHGTQYRVGRDYAAVPVIIMYNDAHIHIFDSDGTELMTHNRATKGTIYVGNNKPRGFMAYQPPPKPTASTPNET